jgi:hypothetical protein
MNWGAIYSEFSIKYHGNLDGKEAQKMPPF